MKSKRVGVLAILLCWFILAVAAGIFRLFTHLPPVAVPLIVGGLTASVIVSYFFSNTMRAEIERLGARRLAVFHGLRLIGAYFLVLEAAGRLPWAFAVPGGWGDIVAALGGFAIAAWPAGRSFKAALLTWNCLGLLDLIYVVSTAARLNFANPDSMRELAQLPLNLLPTFLVPLMLGSHVILFDLARREANRVWRNQNIPEYGV